MSRLYMVFDVESIGLHGEGFAVGYVVVDRDGLIYGSGLYACLPRWAVGTQESREWVAENCPALVANCGFPNDVRGNFWRDWLKFKDRGAVLVADCAWPVESRFLAACVDDEPEQRAWQGPYPLVDVASIRLAAGFDPLGDYPRLPDETPHDPLGDARQSARLLIEALQVLGRDR